MGPAQRSRRFGSALLAVVAGVFLASCGSSDPSDTTTTADSSSPFATATAAAGCTDVAALKSAVQTLTDIEPLQDGLNALEAALADTNTALDTAVASVSAELQPAVGQLETAFAAVQTAADGLTTDNLKEKAPGIVTALRGLETALTSLTATLSQECPES
ncbi:hypothetical protein [Nocardioides bizhenqiangii]|uniref:Lipoprotein n=1 Tax=Nocardioides bizhenqiangii TaxID=3095076 RepID=A0ABZ0ZWM6_9ACTN|nr:hypothetical protein [Nocardioides sp. HM61]WQQ28261.1 hypothetical protein SHK19_08505 [Nocardioides sp. HM61]